MGVGVGSTCGGHFNSADRHALLVAVGGDKLVFYWDVASGRVTRKFRGHTSKVVATPRAPRLPPTPHPSSSFMFFPVDNLARMQQNNAPPSSTPTCLAQVNSVSFGADDNVIVTGSYDRSVRSKTPGGAQQPIPACVPVAACRRHPGALQVRVWDCRSNSWDPIQTMDPFGDAVTSVAVREHEIVAGSVCSALQKHPRSTNSLSTASFVSAQSESAGWVTLQVDGTVRVFDLRKGQVYTDHVGQSVTSISLSNDGKCLLASLLDSRLLLLEKSSGNVLVRCQPTAVAPPLPSSSSLGHRHFAQIAIPRNSGHLTAAAASCAAQNQYTGHRNSEYKIGALLTAAAHRWAACLPAPSWANKKASPRGAPMQHLAPRRNPEG